MLVCVILRKIWTNVSFSAYSGHFGGHLGFQGQMPNTKNSIPSNLDEVYTMSSMKMYSFIFIQRNPAEALFR